MSRICDVLDSGRVACPNLRPAIEYVDRFATDHASMDDEVVDLTLCDDV